MFAAFFVLRVAGTGKHSTQRKFWITSFPHITKLHITSPLVGLLAGLGGYPLCIPGVSWNAYSSLSCLSSRCWGGWSPPEGQDPGAGARSLWQRLPLMEQPAADSKHWFPFVALVSDSYPWVFNLLMTIPQNVLPSWCRVKFQCFERSNISVV